MTKRVRATLVEARDYQRDQQGKFAGSGSGSGSVSRKAVGAHVVVRDYDEMTDTFSVKSAKGKRISMSGDALRKLVGGKELRRASKSGDPGELMGKRLRVSIR